MLLATASDEAVKVVIRYTREAKTHEIMVLVDPEGLVGLDTQALAHGTHTAPHLCPGDDVVLICKVKSLETELL